MPRGLHDLATQACVGPTRSAKWTSQKVVVQSLLRVGSGGAITHGVDKGMLLNFPCLATTHTLLDVLRQVA